MFVSSARSRLAAESLGAAPLRRRFTTPQEGAKGTLDMAGEEAGRGSRIERSETGSDGSRNADKARYTGKARNAAR